MSEAVVNHFRLWLRAGMSGCEFAKMYVAKADTSAIAVYSSPEPPNPAWINRALDVRQPSSSPAARLRS